MAGLADITNGVCNVAPYQIFKSNVAVNKAAHLATISLPIYVKKPSTSIVSAPTTTVIRDLAYFVRSQSKLHNVLYPIIREGRQMFRDFELKIQSYSGHGKFNAVISPAITAVQLLVSKWIREAVSDILIAAAVPHVWGNGIALDIHHGLFHERLGIDIEEMCPADAIFSPNLEFNKRLDQEDTIRIIDVLKKLCLATIKNGCQSPAPHALDGLQTEWASQGAYQTIAARHSGIIQSVASMSHGPQAFDSTTEKSMDAPEESFAVNVDDLSMSNDTSHFILQNDRNEPTASFLFQIWKHEAENAYNKLYRAIRELENLQRQMSIQSNSDPILLRQSQVNPFLAQVHLRQLRKSATSLQDVMGYGSTLSHNWQSFTTIIGSAEPKQQIDYSQEAEYDGDAEDDSSCVYSGLSLSSGHLSPPRKFSNLNCSDHGTICRSTKRKSKDEISLRPQKQFKTSELTITNSHYDSFETSPSGRLSACFEDSSPDRGYDSPPTSCQSNFIPDFARSTPTGSLIEGLSSRDGSLAGSHGGFCPESYRDSQTSTERTSSADGNNHDSSASETDVRRISLIDFGGFPEAIRRIKDCVKERQDEGVYCDPLISKSDWILYEIDRVVGSQGSSLHSRSGILKLRSCERPGDRIYDRCRELTGDILVYTENLETQLVPLFEQLETSYESIREVIEFLQGLPTVCGPK